ncbi:MAG: DUF2934 domain-containing protein [Gemmataceae bacterium]|nr:DUF2934 domain-containing protein [Gemmataceae bacterium]
MLRWFKRRLAQNDSPATANGSGATVAAEVYTDPAHTSAGGTVTAADVAPPGTATAPVQAAPAKPGRVPIPHDKIAARAAEIWYRKGRPHGQDVQNWMEAEAELQAEFASNPPPEPLPRKPR